MRISNFNLRVSIVIAGVLAFSIVLVDFATIGGIFYSLVAESDLLDRVYNFLYEKKAFEVVVFVSLLLALFEILILLIYAYKSVSTNLYKINFSIFFIYLCGIVMLFISVLLYFIFI